MRLLVLGGTSFLGRHSVEAALERGHAVTIFHRGKTNPGLFSGPHFDEVLGDRDGGVSVLRNGRWDAILDTCGYVPRIVRQSARMLAGCAPHYTFVSSISVYPIQSWAGATEEDAVIELEDPLVEQVTGETYGGLKVLCERAVEEELPGRALIIRPGLIVGPHDPTDRFTSWVRRIGLGGDVLAPAPGARRSQFIDVRDLVAWMLDMIEGRRVGVFNATGPTGGHSLDDVLATIREATGSDARFRWASPELMNNHGIAPWSDMPLHIPDQDDTVDVSRAVAMGLAFRPLRETVRDTLAWDLERPQMPLKAGLSRTRERDALRDLVSD